MTVFQYMNVDLGEAAQEALRNVDDTADLLNGLGWAVGGDRLAPDIDNDFVAELVDSLDGDVIDQLEAFVGRLKAAAGEHAS